MDAWFFVAVVIILGALAMDRTRAYRALPSLLSRLRRRSRAASRQQTLGVDSGEHPQVHIDGSNLAHREKEPRHGEGH